MNGEWFAGHHEAIITPEQFAAAHRGRVKGRARGTDLLSGRVRCGLCQRLMALDQNGEGRKLYRCHHRGQGCRQPRRTNVGLHRAAVLGLQLIGDDVELQAAIRRELELARTPAPRAGGGPRTRRSRHGVDDLVAQRRKLLRLYYDDKVGADLFAEEEARLSVAIREAQREADDVRVEAARSDDVAQHFDAVAQLLATLDVDKTWRAATEVERRVLIDEFIEEITVLPDYLDVKVHGAPPVHVLYQEVGLKESGFDRVGGRMFMPGLFTRSLAEDRTVPLMACVGGKDARQVGYLRATEDRIEGLFCRFAIMLGPVGDKVLGDVAGGYYPSFEPHYVVVNQGRGDSGSIEVTEARLHHVALVAVATFESARAATGRTAEYDGLLAPFRNAPRVDLLPLPAFR